LVPVDDSLRPQAIGSRGAVVVTWPLKDPDGAQGGFYVVFRSPEDGSGGLGCNAGGGAKRCALAMQPIGTTHGASYSDIAPPVPSGRWTYRVALAANWHSDPNAGGLTELSPPVEATVP
jgi:hypothetical protein